MKRAVGSALLLVLLAGLLYAAGRAQHVARQAVSDGYQADDASTIYRTGLTTADGTLSLQDSSLQALFISCGGYPSLTITALNPTASATVDLTAIFGDWNGTTFRPDVQQEFRLTFGATFYDTGTVYLADSASIDTGAADVGLVLVRAVSAGTVSLRVRAH